jgi:phage shock protein C
MDKKLYRSNTDRVLSGVIGGISDYLDISSSILRILFVVLAIFGNAFLLLAFLYVLGAVFIPLNPSAFNRYGNSGPFGDSFSSGKDSFKPQEDFVEAFKDSKNKSTVGISLILLGLFFLVNTVFAIPKEYIIAVVLILLGIYIIFKYDKGGK